MTRPRLFDPEIATRNALLATMDSIAFGTTPTVEHRDFPVFDAKTNIWVGYVPFDEQLQYISDTPDVKYRLIVNAEKIDWHMMISEINDCKNIVGISGRGLKGEHLEAIKYMNMLDITYSCANIDLRRLPWLRNLSGDFDKQTYFLNEARQLQSICFLGSQRKEVPFELISALTQLAAIKAKSGQVRSIEMLNKLAHLEILTLHNCRRLTSVAALQKLKQIRHLWMSDARSVEDWAELRGFTELETLWLAQCGVVDLSVDFTNINALRNCSFGGSKVNLQ